MKAYSYHPITKEFISEVECQINPLESKKENKNIYLLPAGATFIKPSEIINGKVLVFIDDKWIFKDDFRNKIYYDIETKERKIINEIGISPDKNWTDKEPLAFDNTCKWEKDNWTINEVMVAELQAETDMEKMIQDKIRQQAIDALVFEGKLEEGIK